MHWLSFSRIVEKLGDVWNIPVDLFSIFIGFVANPTLSLKRIIKQ